MIIQCCPTIPVYTKLGKGRALFLIDYGQDVNTCWVVAINRIAEIKHFDSNDVRLEENYTFGTNKALIPEDWNKE